MKTQSENTLAFPVARPVQSFCILTSEGHSPVMEKVADVLTHQITARCEARREDKADKAEFRIVLSIQKDLKEEAYRIESTTEQEVRLSGGSARGVFYGAGKFLRTSRYDQGGFSSGLWRGESAPEKPFRAIYLASHFGNPYEASPTWKMKEYVQDLGLWGYNIIMLHYPDNFSGFEDPASLRWLSHFKAIMKEAKDCGLMVGLVQVANQCFTPAPPELKFTPMVGRSNYGEAVCTSKPEGRKLVADIYEGILERFKDVGLDVFLFAPYDAGGCGCAECWPWGSRGYLSIVRELVPQVRVHYPGCQILLHTHCFDLSFDNPPLGEWEGLDKCLRQDKSWLDGIVADWMDGIFADYPLKHGVPGGLPIMDFGDTSTYGMFPWGGYGANVFPKELQRHWDRIKHLVCGGQPYSEGIYEDINKAICAGFYWEQDRKAQDIVREYAAYEFGPDVVDFVMELVRILEENVNRRAVRASAVRGFALAQEIDAKMTPQAKAAWRWRIIYLRALIDKDMHEHPAEMTDMQRGAFEELTRIYHAENANKRVKPLDGKSHSHSEGLLSERHSRFITKWQMSELQPPSDAITTVSPVTINDPLGWRETVTLWFLPEEDFVNLHDYYGMQDGLLYLSNRFEVEEDGEWILHLGHDGAAKVFVDGREVLCEPTRINPAPTTRTQVRVRMEAGVHEVLIAFDLDEGAGWGFYFCWENPADLPEKQAFPQLAELAVPV